VNVDLTPEEWEILFQETQQKLELRKVQEEKLQDQEIKRVMFGCPKHAASTIDTSLPNRRRRVRRREKGDVKVRKGHHICISNPISASTRECIYRYCQE
jgi:hypothetical protein